MPFDFFNSQKLTERHYDLAETKWLVKGLLAKQTIALIYAPSGVGKSYFAQALTKMVAPSMRLCAYMDYENRIGDLARRGIDRLPTSVCYIHRATMRIERHSMVCEMAMLALNGYYRDTLIVLDGAKHFISDVDNDRQVREMMGHLTKMRDDGATILIIHHTTKNGISYQGSKELIDGCDNTFSASRTIAPLLSIGISLKVEKMRDSVADKAYLIDMQTLDIDELPAVFAEAKEMEQHIALKVIDELSRAVNEQITKLATNPRNQSVWAW